MDRDMRLRKVCPQCNTVVHVKKGSCCGCGHVFTLKRKVEVSADKSMGKAVKRRRALETVEDTLRRQAQNRTRMASMRASETHEQTLRRQEQDRICTASIIMAGLNACGLQSKLLILLVWCSLKSVTTTLGILFSWLGILHLTIVITLGNLE